MILSKNVESLPQQSPVVLLSGGLDGNNVQHHHQESSSLSGIHVLVTHRSNPDSGSSASTEIFKFLGVPFAEIPERFARPRPLRRLWTGTRMATNFGMYKYGILAKSRGDLGDCIVLL